MNDLKNFADHAAAENDRWLLIVFIMVGVTGAVMLWRWMVSDREKLSARLTQITDRHIQVTEKLSEVVANNTAVLHEVNKKI